MLCAQCLWILYKVYNFVNYSNMSTCYNIVIYTYWCLGDVGIFNHGFLHPGLLSSISSCACRRSVRLTRTSTLDFEFGGLGPIFPVSAGPKCFLHALHVFFLMTKNLNPLPQFIILYNTIFNEICKYLWPARVTIEA